MVARLGKVVTYDKKLQPIKSHNLLNMWSHDLVINEKNFVSTITIPVDTKSGRVVTYNNALPSIKSGPLITWSS